METLKEKFNLPDSSMRVSVSQRKSWLQQESHGMEKLEPISLVQKNASKFQDLHEVVRERITFCLCNIILK